MFLLAHPGCPGQIPQSRKTVVCVCVCSFAVINMNAFIALTLSVGGSKGIQPVKTEWWGAGLSSVWGEVQICIWPK